MIRQIALFFMVGAAALHLSGCAGYQIGSVKPSAYSSINSLHIPPFINRTLEPRISSLVTNAVLKEIQTDGTYKVATRENADAILVAKIMRIDKRQLRAVRTDTLQSRELKLFIVVEYYLEDPDTGNRINSTARALKAANDSEEILDEDLIGVRQGRVIGETIQFVNESYQVGERAAISVAAEDLADKLVSQLANGW